jgi:hypothetical protein
VTAFSTWAAPRVWIVRRRDFRVCLAECRPEVIGRLHLGNAIKLAFPDNSFQAVISLNVIHNPERPDLITPCANRTAGPGTAPQVEASVEEMVLTVKFHRYPTAGSSRSRRPATLAIITGPSLSNGLKLPRRARKRERARGQRYETPFTGSIRCTT